MKTYSQLNLFIRSSIFFLFSTCAIVIFCPILLLLLPFSLETRYALSCRFIGFYLGVLKKICRIDHQVEGIEHLASHPVCLVFSKHQSTWETFFLPCLLRDPAIILKREILWVPFFGWGLATLQPISINRNDKSSAMQQIIQQGKAFLASGRSILIFPEGTRVPVGKIGNYRLGGARLAVATGYPVIPVAHNAGYFWPRRKFIKHPGTVRVVIGEAIPTQNRTPEEVLDEAKSWIEATVSTLPGLVNERTRQQ